MKIAYFDCFSGIAGDMTLGALLDCGVPLDEMKTALRSLHLHDWDIQTTPVLKSGIHGLQVRISVGGESDEEELARVKHHHEHEHSHEDEHSHEHFHGRSMGEIRALIEESALSEGVKRRSLSVFGRIAEVEAQMHHSTPDEIHFHEIGGVDSILDIVGACWCLEWLGVEKIAFSALPYSTGFVDCAHGRMPIPAPATQVLLQGVPMIPTEIIGEMVTPTGAGFVAAFGESFGPMPALTPQIVGCGAGTKEWPDRPNLLRVVVGQSSENASQTPLQVLAEDDLSQKLSGLNWTTLHQIECNIDDMNPEFFALVTERLFSAGALDAWIAPLQMKKNRPAWQLGALCEISQTPLVLTAMLRETSTLGARVQSVQRASLQRSSASVETEFGACRVKTARWDEAKIRRSMPEWDDVELLARAHNVTAREVYEAASRAANVKTAQTEAA